MGELSNGDKLQFFLIPKFSLNGLSPLKAVAEDKVNENISSVKNIAKSFTER